MIPWSTCLPWQPDWTAHPVQERRFYTTSGDTISRVGSPHGPRSFETIEELRLALLEFRETYNTTWPIERHGFITPAAVRQNQLQPADLAA